MLPHATATLVCISKGFSCVINYVMEYIRQRDDNRFTQRRNKHYVLLAAYFFFYFSNGVNAFLRNRNGSISNRNRRNVDRIF